MHCKQHKNGVYERTWKCRLGTLHNRFMMHTCKTRTVLAVAVAMATSQSDCSEMQLGGRVHE